MVATPTVIPAKPAIKRTELIRESAKPSTARARAGEDRYRMIAEAAYFRAEARGFESGNELNDWLAAEIEVDDILGAAGPR
jgi:hypothetical protein